MALYNQNYQAIVMNAGTTHTFNIFTAATVHQIFCLSAGTIDIVAAGGGSFTWSAVTSEYMDVMVGRCTINSGQFVGFKTQNSMNQYIPYYKY